MWLCTFNGERTLQSASFHEFGYGNVAVVSPDFDTLARYWA
jgi:hypothetical protein